MLHRFKFKTAFLITLFTPVGYNTLLANFTPPPPSISKYNELNLGNAYWRRENEMGPSEYWYLYRDQRSERIWKESDTNWSIQLNGNVLTVGKGGINANIAGGFEIRGSGQVTSSERWLVLSSVLQAPIYMDIHSTISNATSHEVGLQIKGTDGRMGEYRLMGANSNTFTGGIEITGRGQKLHLIKEAGALAIRGNVHIRNGAEVRIGCSEQVDRLSTVVLSGSGSTLDLKKEDLYGSITQTLRRLVVYNDGIVCFSTSVNRLFLDELIIYENASLTVRNWYSHTNDHFLVKKTSQHLADALDKIRFQGHLGKAGVRDYNNDYWEIGVGAGFRPLPEPTTYGAAFSVAALALWAYRRKRHVPLTADSRI